MKQLYIDTYHNHQKTIKEYAPSIMNEKRDALMSQFVELGFPTSKNEDYKYTDLKAALSVYYNMSFDRSSTSLNPYQNFSCDVPELHSHLYFVVNESFYPVPNNRNAKLPEGVIIGGLKEIAEKYPELVAQYYTKLTADKKDTFIAQNGAFAQDGFFMYVPDNVELEYPVQLINIMHADEDFMASSHNLIVLGKNAKAQLLVCDHVLDSQHLMANRITEVFVDEHAEYEHYMLENTHIKNAAVNTVFVNQKGNSKALVNVVSLHNGATRNNIEIALNGEYAETELYGLVIADKKQHVDNFTNILHNKPNCHSTELFKYVLDETAKGVFSGRIYVEKDAQKTEAYQNNRNILLNKTAKIRTRPQLEIYADDVSCSHGATIGQLDEQALFYMRTRGISYSEARMLLMYAFAADVIENIRIPSLAERIQDLVEKRLRGELSKCEGCMLC